MTKNPNPVKNTELFSCGLSKQSIEKQHLAKAEFLDYYHCGHGDNVSGVHRSAGRIPAFL